MNRQADVGAPIQPAQSRRRTILRIGILVLLSALTLSLHYSLFPFPHWVHLVHRRLCYVPIILGGLWFGLRGGLLMAMAISLSVIPLAVRMGSLAGARDELIEMVFYLALGGLTGFLVDRREAERRRKEELENRLRESRRLAEMGQMAAGVAHEIRNPLGSIRGSLEILEEDFPEDHPKRPFLEIMNQETDRLKRVTEEFMDLSRPVPLDPVDLDLCALLGDTVRSIAARSARPRIELECPPNPVAVNGDPDKVRRILDNLIGNALVLSPENGVVSVRLSCSGASAVIGVDDQGPGLPAGDEERIFEPFFSKRKDGTGLGLATAHRIALAHGGDIKAENLPGGGARFELRIPVNGAPL